MNTSLQKITLHSKNLSHFLQRIITQDITLCSDHPKMSAICNAYGKVTVIFWIQFTNGYATLWIDDTELPVLIKTLQHYDPFSEITIEHSTSLPSEKLLPFSKDPWALQRIKESIITLNPEIRNKYIPQVLSLDKHNAISFNKGCFIGHEPIARTHFKGRIKRRLHYQTSTVKPSNALNCYYLAPHYHYLSIEPVNLT